MSHEINRRTLLSRGAWVATGAALGWAWARLVPWDVLAGGEPASPGHEERLKKLKLVLPKVEAPKGPIFVPAVRVGDMLYVSGHIALKDGKPVVGKVGKDLNVKEGRAAARLVGLSVLAVVRQELGSLDRVVRLVKTLGMVNCTSDFTEQPEVVNGFSALMVEVFGDKAGKGTRSAVGMGSLPRGAAVEVEALFQVKG
jgi:enamine deaminase RidA (YjgF/YER057c/UK114 family)